MTDLRSFFIITLFISLASFTQAQVGIGTSTVNSSAKLQIDATDKGFLPPRMTTTQRNAIPSPATGLVIFNTTTNSLETKKSTGWVTLSESFVALPTVVIGTQQWMRENLEVTSYRNGDLIPEVELQSDWNNLTTGAWCWYNNDPANGAIYGKLYNWYAVTDERGLCPVGWHVPTDAEWTTLSTFLGGNMVAGGKMKMTGNTRWSSPNLSATNSSGFAGLPGGSRSNIFEDVGAKAYWWSSSQGTGYVWARSLIYNDGYISVVGSFPEYAYSVRCIRD